VHACYPKRTPSENGWGAGRRVSPRVGVFLDVGVCPKQTLAVPTAISEVPALAEKHRTQSSSRETTTRLSALPLCQLKICEQQLLRQNRRMPSNHGRSLKNVPLEQRAGLQGSNSKGTCRSSSIPSLTLTCEMRRCKAEKSSSPFPPLSLSSHILGEEPRI